MEQTMNQYTAFFDFTTVHKNGRFVGRSGQCDFESKNEYIKVLTEFDKIEPLCAGFVLSQKPKWQIFSLNITDIKIKK